MEGTQFVLYTYNMRFILNNYNIVNIINIE